MATDPIGSNNKPVLQQPPKDPNDIMRDVDVGDFLKLMITEMQNQDPLNPMDNAQLLSQLGEMQSINASRQLSDTLQGIRLGQNLTSATSLINRQIVALDDAGEEVIGVVERVTVNDGEPSLVVGDSTVKVSNVREVLGVLTQ